MVHSDSIGAMLYPFVLETFGIMGPAFHKFLRYVAFELFERSSNIDPESEDQLKSAVGCTTLCKHSPYPLKVY